MTDQTEETKAYNLLVAKRVLADHEENIENKRESLRNAELLFEIDKKRFSAEIEEIRRLEIAEYNRKRKEKADKKSNRQKVMRQNLKIGDWVVVKTRSGNTAKQIVRFDGDEKWGYGAYCELPEKLVYVYGYAKGKYKKPTWYVNESESRMTDRRIDLYAFNSIVCRLTTNQDGSVNVERFN